jgi:hypothetical protein
LQLHDPLEGSMFGLVPQEMTLIGIGDQLGESSQVGIRPGGLHNPCRPRPLKPAAGAGQILDCLGGTGRQPAAVDQGVQCPHCGTAQPAIKAGAVAAFIGKLVMLTTTGTGFELMLPAR